MASNRFHESWFPHRMPATTFGLSILMFAGCQQLSLGTLAIDPDNIAGARGKTAADSSKAAADSELQPMLSTIADLERKGELDKAIVEYKKLVADNKATPTVYRRLAVLHDRGGQFDQSAKYYLAALQLSANDAEILCDYGYSRFVQGDLAVARETLRRAIDIEPQLARAHNNLGLVLARLGEQNEALAEFQKAGCSDEQAKMNLAVATMSSNVDPRSR